jgi:hypothetical protein
MVIMAGADLGELRQTQTKCFEARKQRVGSFFSIILGNQQPGTTQVGPGGWVEGQYLGGHFFRRELLAMAEIHFISSQGRVLALRERMSRDCYIDNIVRSKHRRALCGADCLWVFDR